MELSMRCAALPTLPHVPWLLFAALHCAADGRNSGHFRAEQDLCVRTHTLNPMDLFSPPLP